MFRKVLTLTLIVLVLNVFTVQAATGPQQAQPETIEKVRRGVSELGSGPEAKVEVKLRDGRKIKGYVADSEANSFVVVDAKTGASNSIEYSQVKELKGRNSLTAKKVAINVAKGVLIVAAVAGAATLFMYLIVRASGDGG